MNPFVNPNKRSILLPSGCKDLADVLRLRAPETGDPVQAFVRLVLLRAEGVGASQVLISAPMVHDGECSVTQRVNGMLRLDSTIPAALRSQVIEELFRMADLPQGVLPASGVVCVQLKRRQLKWKIEMESAESECVLAPFTAL